MAGKHVEQMKMGSYSKSKIVVLLGLLDAMTNGGRGIALLSPVSNQRYFLPWTPIEVSPIGVRAFISQRGLAVMKSEILWIWLPVVSMAIFGWIVRRFKFRPSGRNI